MAKLTAIRPAVKNGKPATNGKKRELRIVRIEQENIKGIRVAEITPDGNWIVVGGENESGKTSLLDAIQWAMKGVERTGNAPLRRGATRGRSLVDVGDFIVERVATAADPKGRLVVKSADGAVYPSPQAMLDELFSRISFDPLAFARLDDREQAKQLRELVGLDFTALDAKRQRAFDERTRVGRDLKKAEAHRDSLPFNHTAPAAEVSVAELAQEHERRNEVNADNASTRAELETLDQRANVGKDKLAEVEAEIAKLQAKRDDFKKRLAEIAAARLILAEKVDHLADLDTADVLEQIRTAEATNADVRRNTQRETAARQAATLRTEHEEYTATIKAVDAERAELLAKTTFPVAGLGFDEAGQVTYHGVPFADCSSEEATRISTSIAIGLNPQLKVLLIRNGSLLTPKKLAVLAEMAEASGMQVWVEWACENKEGVQIWVENGVATKLEPATVQQGDAVLGQA